MKLLIAFANYNRQKIAQMCAYQLFNTKAPEDRLVIYDDGTKEYDPSEAFKDRCDTLCENENMGIDKQRMKQIEDFVLNYSDYDYLYFTDSDAYHDPNWREMLLKIQDQSKLITGLYNSRFHTTTQLSDDHYCVSLALQNAQHSSFC